MYNTLVLARGPEDYGVSFFVRRSKVSVVYVIYDLFAVKGVYWGQVFSENSYIELCT